MYDSLALFTFTYRKYTRPSFVFECSPLLTWDYVLRWINTFFARALLANAMQLVHKDYKTQHAIDTTIILFPQCLLYLCYFFFVIQRSVLMVLVFYYKGMLEKVTMQRTQQFSDFPLLSKEPS